MRKMFLVVIALMILLPLSAAAQENTLQDARVGEWAVYAMSNGRMQERHSVTTRRRSEVVVKVESIINGRVFSSKTEEWDVDDPKNFAGAEPGHQITANGRTYTCFAVKRGQSTYYYSNEVPVTGLVAVYKGNRAVKEIKNFDF